MWCTGQASLSPHPPASYVAGAHLPSRDASTWLHQSLWTAATGLELTYIVLPLLPTYPPPYLATKLLTSIYWPTKASLVVRDTHFCWLRSWPDLVGHLWSLLCLIGASCLLGWANCGRTSDLSICNGALHLSYMLFYIYPTCSPACSVVINGVLVLELFCVWSIIQTILQPVLYKVGLKKNIYKYPHKKMNI